MQLIPVQTSFACTSDRVLCQRGIFDNFESGIDEWTSNVELSTTGQCGGLSSILGGFGVLGQGAWLEKTYDLAAYPHDELSLSLDFIKIDSWDNEEASVLIDGVVVWSQIFIYNEGSDFCGNSNYAEWLDEKLKVGPFEMAHDTDTLTLRVETTLNEDPNNESFGIDNVRLILQMLGYLDRFERSADYWSFADGSPARTSECGSFGSILGGYDIIAGGGNYLQKTFDLKAMEHDQLAISFDFIKIDSWDDEAAQLFVDDVEVWSRIYGGGSLGGIAECGSDNGGWVEIDDFIELMVSHTSASATLRFQTGLNSGATDESFGVDNVKMIPVYTSLNCGVGHANVLCRQGFFESFDDGVGGWTSNVELGTSGCDSLGQILGGAGMLGGSTLVSKTFDLSPISHDSVTISLDFIKIDSWDNEDANVYVLVGDEPPALIEGPEGRSGPDPDADHGELVWSKTYGVGDGEQLCGAGNGWNELSDTVTFEITGSSAYVTITVDTTLSSAASDEAWGLDNVLVLPQLLGYRDEFTGHAWNWVTNG